MKAVMQSWEYARSTGRARSSLHAHTHTRESPPLAVAGGCGCGCGCGCDNHAHEFFTLIIAIHVRTPTSSMSPHTKRKHASSNALPSFLSSFPPSASLPRYSCENSRKPVDSQTLTSFLFSIMLYSGFSPRMHLESAMSPRTPPRRSLRAPCRAQPPQPRDQSKDKVSAQWQDAMSSSAESGGGHKTWSIRVASRLRKEAPASPIQQIDSKYPPASSLSR